MSRTEAIKARMGYLQKIANIVEDLERKRSWYVEFEEMESEDDEPKEKAYADYQEDWNLGMVQIYDDLLDYLSKKAK